MKPTPKSIADECGISERWARTLCRRVLGRRKYYRLTPDEKAKVVDEYHKWKRESSNEACS